MANEKFRLGYTSSGNDVYALDVVRFADTTLPRQSLDNVSVEFATLGAGYGIGPIGSLPKIWTIDTVLYRQATSFAQKNGVSYDEVKLINELFAAWDADRGNGLAARLTISDELLSFGSAYSAQAWFTTAPAYSLVDSYGNNLIAVTFGLTEV